MGATFIEPAASAIATMVIFAKVHLTKASMKDQEIEWLLIQKFRSQRRGVAIFERGDDQLALDLELPKTTPNYYEVQIQLACLDHAVQDASITILIYHEKVRALFYCSPLLEREEKGAWR